MSVSAITQKVLARFSPNYIFRFFLPISSASSLMGHVDLLFDLLYSGLEMSVGATAKKFPPDFHQTTYLDSSYQ